jgi:hypothetical protein
MAQSLAINEANEQIEYAENYLAEEKLYACLLCIYEASHWLGRAEALEHNEIWDREYYAAKNRLHDLIEAVAKDYEE